MNFWDAQQALNAKLKGTKFKAINCDWAGEDGDYSQCVWKFTMDSKHPRSFDATYDQIMQMPMPMPKGLELQKVYNEFARM